MVVTIGLQECEPEHIEHEQYRSLNQIIPVALEPVLYKNQAIVSHPESSTRFLFPFPSLSSSPYLHAFVVSGIRGTNLSNVKLRIMCRPTDVSRSVALIGSASSLDPATRLHGVTIHRAAISSKCPWKNSIRSERERTGKEIKDATRTPELPNSLHVRSLYFPDPHFVLSVSSIRLLAFRSFAVFTGSHHVRILAELRAGWVGWPHARISSYAICNAHAQPSVVHWLSRGANAFESVHYIHWESARMDRVQISDSMKLRLLRTEFEKKHTSTAVLHSTSDMKV